MKTLTNQNQDNQSHSTTARNEQSQTSTFQFKDNRPEAIQMRKLQTSIQNSSKNAFQFVDNRPEAMVQRKLQEIADNSPQSKQAVQLQEIADNHSLRKQQTVQKKGNSRGVPSNNLKTGNITQPLVQRAIRSRKIGDSNEVELANLAAIADEYNITVQSLYRPIQRKLFTNPLFSDPYKNAFAAQSHGIREEMVAIIDGLDALILASNSRSTINANSGDSKAIGKQIVVILGNAINAQYLNGFPNYNIIHNLGDAGEVTSYTNMIAELITRANTYRGQIHANQYDLASQKTNSRMENRLAKLDEIKDTAMGLRDELDNAVTAANDTGAIIARVNTLTGELDTLENAWDLDWRDTYLSLDTNISNLKQTNGEWGSHYEDDGGEDDGMSVGDVYSPNLACTLYSILEVKPGWLGAANPGDLHKILRKTDKLKEYDDNQVAAKVRYLAGLNPTRVTNGDGGTITLGAYLQREKEANRTQSRIFDVTGMAHTFAAAWKGGDFKKVDDSTPNGGAFDANYNQNIVLWVWQ